MGNKETMILNKAKRNGKEMSNTINLDEYLTYDEKKEIAVNVFTGKLRDLSKSEVERIVSNMAYSIAQEIVDKNFDKQFKKQVKDKLPTIISELSAYTVFNKGDTYGAFAQPPTVGWKMIEEAVKENELILKTRVKEVLKNIDDYTLKDKISEAIYEAVTTPIKEVL